MQLRNLTLALIAFFSTVSVSLAENSGNADLRVSSIQKASDEDLAVATGHFARSRALLIAAIREFDLGCKVANPDSILDAKAFRGTISTRAEELERILDPQPRVTRGGIRYSPEPALLSKHR